MNYRENINSKLGALVYTPWAVVAIIVIGLVFTTQVYSDSGWPVFGLIALLAFSGVIAFLGRAWSAKNCQCPQCGFSLTALSSACNSFPTYRLSEKIRFCPHCGLDLESEIEANQELEPKGSRPRVQDRASGSEAHL